ncbi:MAG: hypothetical protein M3Q82_02195 [Actinomycetota bacterium]|nr:hypothetical protein [Actinomycetota bacterium]
MASQRRPQAQRSVSETAPYDELAERRGRRQRKERRRQLRRTTGPSPPPVLLTSSPSPEEFWPLAGWQRPDDDTQTPA